MSTTQSDFNFHPKVYANDPDPANPSAAYAIKAGDRNTDNELDSELMPIRMIYSNDTGYIADNGSTSGEARWLVLVSGIIRAGDFCVITYHDGSNRYMWAVKAIADNDVRFSDTDRVGNTPSWVGYHGLRTTAGVTLRRMGRGDGSLNLDDFLHWISGEWIMEETIATAKIEDAAITNPKIAINAIQTANIVDANVTDAKLDPDNTYPWIINDRFDSSISDGDYALGQNELKDAYAVMSPAVGQINRICVNWGGNGGSAPAALTEIEVYRNSAATGLKVIYDGSTKYMHADASIAINISMHDAIAVRIKQAGIGSLGTSHIVAVRVKIKNAATL